MSRKAKIAIVALNGADDFEKMTMKQREFVRHYAKTQDKIDSARKAGYKNPHADAYRLMESPSIRAEIEKIMSRSNERLGINVDYIKAKLVDTIEVCSQLIPVTDDEGNPVNTTDSEGQPKQVVKMMDAGGVLRAVEILGKHVDVRAFSEQKEININVSSEDRVAKLLSDLQSMVGEIKPKQIQHEEVIDAEYEAKDNA